MVGLLGNGSVFEAMSGLFFGAVYAVRWTSNDFAAVKNGYSILIGEKEKV